MAKSKRVCDLHHCCWPKKDWNKGYAKELRCHWYLIIEIPKNTLHREIHHELKGIPLPKGSSGKRVYECLIKLENGGVLNKKDPPWERLYLLATLFKEVSPLTSKAFKHQAKIIRKFYQSPQ